MAYKDVICFPVKNGSLLAAMSPACMLYERDSNRPAQDPEGLFHNFQWRPKESEDPKKRFGIPPLCCTPKIAFYYSGTIYYMGPLQIVVKNVAISSNNFQEIENDCNNFLHKSGRATISNLANRLAEYEKLQKFYDPNWNFPNETTLYIWEPIETVGTTKSPVVVQNFCYFSSKEEMYLYQE